jgi:hypothetical protein
MKLEANPALIAPKAMPGRRGRISAAVEGVMGQMAVALIELASVVARMEFRTAIGLIGRTAGMTTRMEFRTPRGPWNALSIKAPDFT